MRSARAAASEAAVDSAADSASRSAATRATTRVLVWVRLGPRLPDRAEEVPVAGGDAAEAVEPPDRLVERLGAEQDRHRVELPLLVELPDPRPEVLLGDVGRLPGHVELDPQAGQAGLGGLPPGRQRLEVGAGCGEPGLEGVELLGGRPLLRREGAVLLPQLGDSARGRGCAARRRERQNRGQTQQNSDSARCELARAPAHEGGRYQTARACNTGDLPATQRFSA